MRDAGRLAREIGGVQKEISEHLSQQDDSILVIEQHAEEGLHAVNDGNEEL